MSSNSIRDLAKSVIMLLRKVRNPHGMTLNNIHQYIRAAYPHKSPNLVTLTNVLEKISAVGAVEKKYNRYVLGNMIKKSVTAKEISHGKVKRAIRQVKGRGSRRRRSRSRSRRRKPRRSRSRRRWCPRNCDKYLCWPSTPPGTNHTQLCPAGEGIVKGGTAYRYCSDGGTWETRNMSNSTYTHYENCLLPQLQELLQMCDEFGETTCIEVGFFWLSSNGQSATQKIEKRNKLSFLRFTEKTATLLHDIFRLVKYIDQELEPGKKFLNTGYLLQINIALLEYARTALFLWMFIEGLYLHNMITVTVFQEYNYIKIYCYVGWILPGVMSAVWLITMLVEDMTWEYYYFLNYYWILEGPRAAVIIINLMFLLNIIRVLVVKLRESRTSEIEQVRKAVRAAIFLLPLMGISHILFFHYKFNEAWKFAAWMFLSYFLGTFQGFFVAVLYCFLNGEVQTAIKNSFYLRMSLRNNDYAPCRNFALISLGPEHGAIQNGETAKWILCCKYKRSSVEETEINSSRDNWMSKNTVEETDMSLIQAPLNEKEPS
ncbi:unnamed protein product [Phyllotreta striolata]|uniref:G-protein coupled receptors family 2 profile 1 domain-containing protein n=1 Tax=Phyllotreta striolata TaxID=444603 RepID=A0A9N9XJT5_PHYSR|nr:unnamed protein product [Phyllotreta striolata]